MTNNDILRQLRYIFDYSDEDMMSIFKSADFEANKPTVIDWLKKDEDQQLELSNAKLNIFLDGLINQKRGKKETYQLKMDNHLTNNIILRKLKIALNFKDVDLIDIFKLADVNIGKHELSAFFRNPKQSQYRDMGNQYLRNFLFGLRAKFRS